MMNITHKHSVQTTQLSLGTVAYWSAINAPMFSNNDRGGEIKVGFEEGDGYA
jgi:hypothetical protein